MPELTTASVAPAPSKETLKSLVLAWSDEYGIKAPVDPAAKRRASLTRAKTEAESIIAVLSDVPESGRPESVSTMLAAQRDRLAGIETALAALPKVESLTLGREAQHALLRKILSSALDVESVLFV